MTPDPWPTWTPEIFVIAGPPRCGKSTLAGMLLRERHVPFYSTDAVRHMLEDPRVRVSTPLAEAMPDLVRRMAESAIWMLTPPAVAFEGDELDSRYIERLRELAPVRACYLGRSVVRLSEVADGWVAQLAPDEQADVAKRIEDDSRRLAEDADSIGVPFFDVSENFSRALDAALAYLVSAST